MLPIVVVWSVRLAGYVEASSGGCRWGGGELLWLDFSLAVDEVCKGGGVQPWWWNDVRSSLLFEEEGEPEREVGTVRWAEGWCFAL